MRQHPNQRSRAGASVVRVAAACVLALALFAAPSFAQQSAKLLQGISDPEAPIYIEAETFFYDKALDRYEFDGAVVVTQGDLRMEADHISLDLGIEKARAEGHVWVTNTELTVAADEVDADMATQTGVVVSGQLVMAEQDYEEKLDVRYYLSGEKIEKIGEDRYRITRGTYTTCDCGVGTPSWRVTGRKMRATLDGYGTIYDAVFYWWKVPILYTPWAMVPVKVTRQTGFLMPEWAYSESEGVQINLPFYWAMSDWADATIYSHWIEKRGLKEGLEFRYKIAKEVFGEFNIDAIDDRQFEGAAPGELRWDLQWEGRARIWNKLEFRHDVALVSDPKYIVDFEDDISARFDRYLRSTLIVANRWDRYSLNASSRTFQDLVLGDNATVFNEVPAVSLAGMSQPIVHPLLVRFNVDATHFERSRVSDIESIANNAVEDDLYVERGQRVSAEPEILVPWNIRHAVVVTPRAGLIETFYHAHEREDPILYFDTKGRIKDTGLPPDRQDERWEFRHTYFGEINVTTEFQRVFPLKSRLVSGLKHSIEPGLTYRYQAEPSYQRGNPIFDGFDRIERENVITGYLYNRLWARAFSVLEQKFITLKLVDLKITEEFDVEEVIRPKLYEEVVDTVTYQIDYKEIERRPFSDLMFDLRAVAAAGFFIDKLLFDGQLDWNLYDLYLSRANGLVAILDQRGDALLAEYRYRTDAEGNKAIQSLTGSLNVRIVDAFEVSYSTKYEFLENQFIENVYSAHYYSLQNCWDVTFQVEDRRRPDETVFRLLFNLTGLANLTGSRGFGNGATE